MRRFAFIAIAMLLLSVAAPAAADDVGPFHPADAPEVTVAVGDQLILSARWGTCTEGLARSARRAIRYEYYIDGEPVDATFDFGMPVVWVDHPLAWACTMPTADIWFIYAEYPVVFDAPGDYSLRLEVFADRRITDGADLDEDGRIDIYGGLVGTLYATVHVTDG